MFLPQAPLYCIHTLEAAGYRAYAVGGCVRDSLLGLTPADFDLCTNATPEETARVFQAHQLLHHGQKHGTVGVVLEQQVIEITTFRSEGGYDDCRHPGWVAFVPTVEEDLARRDFTVNAMAYHPTAGYVDPFGGRQDLKDGILRAVGDPNIRFREDALRILRGVRFSARFRLSPEPATKSAMETLAPLMEHLARERVFEELCKLLISASARDLLTFAPILTQVIPELQPCVGFQQHNPHHLHDVYTHICHVVEAVPPVLPLRWAALLHDIGKPPVFSLDADGTGHFYGHAQESARLAEEILLRFKAPTALRQQVCTLIHQHMTRPEPDKKLLRRRLSKLGLPLLEDLLLLQQADTNSKGTDSPEEAELFSRIRQLLSEIQAEDACLRIKDLAVNGRDLLALDFPPGPALGSCLVWLFEQVLDEKLQNCREALLIAAKEYLTNHQEEAL